MMPASNTALMQVAGSFRLSKQASTKPRFAGNGRSFRRS